MGRASLTGMFERFRIGRRVAIAGIAVLLVLPAPGAPASGDAAEHWVDGSSPACSDAYSRVQTTSPETPWCSVAHAAAAAQPGDTVRILPSTYRGEVRPAVSGAPTAPIRYLAPQGGVTIDAAGAPAAVKLVSVSDVSLEGLTVTGAAVQGIWVSGAQRILLDRVAVRGNGGPGIQIRDASAVTVSGSVIESNGGAGIFEASTTGGGRYVGNQIRGNGINGEPYNGDGMQIAGVGAYIRQNTITDNGDPGPYEHGIYMAATARDFLVEGNVLSGNAGSNIKAAGADGVVRYNRLESGRLGLVLSDNPSPVSVYENLILGRYQHAVLVTDGTTPAQGRLWNNTIVVSARQGDTGDASAIFVKAATLLDLRNNLISYTNPDNAGSAVYVKSSSQIGTLVSDNNWFSTPESKGRHLIWNDARVTLARWQREGLDLHGSASPPPSFDADAQVTSANLGRARGQVGLTRDYRGTPIPSGTAPDVSAYQTP